MYLRIHIGYSVKMQLQIKLKKENRFVFLTGEGWSNGPARGGTEVVVEG